MPTRITYLPTYRRGKRSFYKTLKYPEIPTSVNDLYIVTTVGDRLDTLAHQYYNDSDHWWIIATANPNVVRRDSYNLTPFLELRIPHDYQSILNDFEELNKNK
jgi:hypothetical protein